MTIKGVELTETEKEITDLDKLAENGNIDAQYEIAEDLSREHSTPMNRRLTYMYYYIAASNGHTGAKIEKEKMERSRKVPEAEISRATDMARNWMKRHPKHNQNCKINKEIK